MPASGNDVFPTLQSCTKLSSVLPGSDGRTEVCIHDVKFYPFGTVNDEQIFAVVGEKHAIVYRTKLGADPPFEILNLFRDDSASLNSLTWTRDPTTRKPLLCLAGHVPRHVKIIDVESGNVIRTLSGHGRGINDLAISPISDNILASGAEDNTIRLWNLRPDHEEQPCVAILAGEGHKSPVLAIHFHPNGRWLLSGGIDTAVCLWAVPELEDLHRHPEAEDQEPKIVYYPLFFSKELHSNYVDCLAFYGDLIISKAARDQQKEGAGPITTNEILIWKIDGFDSSSPAPLEPPIPVPAQQTRSAFIHEAGFRGFQRLLTLNMPHTDRFYHRFGILQNSDMRPILAMGTQKSELYFWDLQRLDEGVEAKKAAPRGRKLKSGRGIKIASSSDNLSRLGDLRRSESAGGSTSGPSPDPSSTEPTEREFTLNDRFKPLEPHYKKYVATQIIDKHFATSQVAWSPDGTWMVGVGDYGVMCMFHRDKSVVRSINQAQADLGEG